MLGLSDTKTSARTRANTRTPRLALGALGRGLLCPLAPRSVRIWDKGNKQHPTADR